VLPIVQRRLTPAVSPLPVPALKVDDLLDALKRV
jgi:hypothetical protein